MEKFGAGQSPRRIEDDRLLKGEACFGDDLRAEGMLHCIFVRSSHAHAEIGAIATAAALEMPGVVGVLTGRDLAAAGIGPLPGGARTKRKDGRQSSGPPRHALAVDRVRFVGEAVAAVIAESHAEAEDAAELVSVDYRPLPALLSVEAAAAPDAGALWPDAPGNVAAYARFGDAAATAAAFQRAAHVVRLRLVNNRLVPNALEPRAALARWDAASGRLTLETVSQTPATLRQQLADAVLKVPAATIRVLVPDIGGGFGLKTNLHPEDAVIAVAARQFGRPVKWRATRSEEFLAATHGRDQVNEAGLALDGDGRILALRIATLADLGAYITPAGAVVAIHLGPRVLVGTYDVPAIDVEVSALLTNSCPTAPYRGAGRPEGIYVIERLMDEAAARLAIDPVEIRRRNFIRPDAFPHRTAGGDIYDCGDFARVLEEAVAASDWVGFAARRAESERKGLLRGRGLASFIEWTGAGVFAEQVAAHIDANGRVTLFSATQAMGQGLATSYAQLVAGALELPIACIKVVQGDTDTVTGIGSVASRSLFVGGPAAIVCARSALEKARALAADALEAAVGDLEYRAGRFTVVGTDRAIGLFELAARQSGERIAVELRHTVAGASWPNGCHVAEIEIDPETGSVHVDSYTAIDDVGTVVNPMIVAGQAHGSLAQGIGQALLERTVYDVDGQLLTASFLDYAMPRADDLPAFRVGTVAGIPSRNNPLGAKGAGEMGCVGAPPAIVAAVLDALRPFGVHSIDMPATPEKVWQAIQSAHRNPGNHAETGGTAR
jgi:carbon-monoxide dehydrogenase large subunit